MRRALSTLILPRMLRGGARDRLLARSHPLKTKAPSFSSAALREREADGVADFSLLRASPLPFNNVKLEVATTTSASTDTGGDSAPKDRANSASSSSDSTTSPASSKTFASDLAAAVAVAATDSRKAVWLHLVGADQCMYAPDALRQGFRFHHALDDKAVLTRWLDETMPNKIPPFATHQVGCAGFTTRYHPVTGRREVLLVKEARMIEPWKLPGGIADRGEEFGDAAVREVFEETGVVARYTKRVFSMRNSHGLAHGKSDLYVVVHLEAEDGAEVSIDEDEIDAAEWHDLEEVAKWTTHPINRECLRALGVAGVDGAVDEDADGNAEEDHAPPGAIREITTRLRPDRPPFKLYFVQPQR